MESNSFRKKTLVIISTILVFGLLGSLIENVAASGLTVFVKVTHVNNGSTRICVNSIYQNLGCRTVSLAGTANPYTSTWNFGDGLVPVGGQFKACVTNLSNNQYRCSSGSNRPAKVPEYVYITVPGGQISSVDYRAACNL